VCDDLLIAHVLLTQSGIVRSSSMDHSSKRSFSRSDSMFSEQQVSPAYHGLCLITDAPNSRSHSHVSEIEISGLRPSTTGFTGGLPSYRYISAQPAETRDEFVGRSFPCEHRCGQPVADNELGITVLLMAQETSLVSL
jgi:hypothetical protein